MKAVVLAAMVTVAMATAPVSAAWEYRLVAAGYLDGVSSGRFEARPSATDAWGTVCDDEFGTTDADVACRALGFTGSVTYWTAYGTEVGAFDQPTHMDELGCTGTEARPDECSFVGTAAENCFASEAVMLTCRSGLAFRMVAAGTLDGATSGRVEARETPSFEWGYVCRSYLSLTDATPICAAVGLGSATEVRIATTAEAPTGTVASLAHSVYCYSDTCYLSSFAATDCSAGSGALVLTCTPPRWEYRLVQSYGIVHVPGTSASSGFGRAEARFGSGAWGSICRLGLSTEEYTAVCRALGYEASSGTNVIGSGYSLYRAPSGQTTTMSSLDCTGSESVPDECTFTQGATCSDDDALVIECTSSVAGQLPGTPVPLGTPVPPGTPGEYRLVSASGTTIGTTVGRLEARFGSNDWGTVCDDSFDAADAQVACRSLALPSDNAVFTSQSFASRSFPGLDVTSLTQPIAMDDLGCSGDEAQLHLCSFTGQGSHNCVHSEDVMLACLANATAAAAGVDAIFPTSALSPVTTTFSFLSTWQYRLVDANGAVAQLSGRLEARASAGATWGTICDDNFGADDAAIACQSLGLSRSDAAFQTASAALQGPSTQPTVMDELGCFGTEASLDFCSFVPESEEDCTSAEAIELTCVALPTLGPSFMPTLPASSWEYRLLDVDGQPSPGPAILEARASPNEPWGSVCSTGFTNSDASVACRSVNYAGDGATFSQSGGSPVSSGAARSAVMVMLSCDGSEGRLDLCSFNSPTPGQCTSAQDVVLHCQGAELTLPPTPAPPPVWEYRLVAASGVSVAGQTQGRLEVRFGPAAFGTVCDDGFGINEAVVACRSVGVSETTSVDFRTVSRRLRGAPTQPVTMDDVVCSGTEGSLDACVFTGTAASDCGFGEAVELICNTGGGNLQQPSAPADTAAPISYAGVESMDGYRYRLIETATNISGVPSRTSGRLEVRSPTSGDWSFVCGRGFTLTAAKVACASLEWDASEVIFRYRSVQGSETPSATQAAAFASGLFCLGNEYALDECADTAPYLQQGPLSPEGGPWAGLEPEELVTPPAPSCAAAQAVYVQCEPREEVAVDLSDLFASAPWGYRLEGGPNTSYGRLEVQPPTTPSPPWGSVCSSDFDAEDAAVACRSLGFDTSLVTVSFTTTAVVPSMQPPTSQPVHLAGLGCVGFEGRLDLCNNATGATCARTEHVVLHCARSTWEYRLIDVPGVNSGSGGRLEARPDAESGWGAVCTNGFGRAALKVACSTLGLTYVTSESAVFSLGNVARNAVVYIGGIDCAGSEGRLEACTRTTAPQCEAVGVTCAPAPQPWLMRLAGGSFIDGRLEARENTTRSWGTLCANGFDSNAARVACRSLGFDPERATTTVIPASGSTAGIGSESQPVFAAGRITCRGSEEHLSDCELTALGSCAQHSQDVALTCRPRRASAAWEYRVSPSNATVADVRPNATSIAGRLEARKGSGTVPWGSVCDDGFDARAAAAACRALLPQQLSAIASFRTVTAAEAAEAIGMPITMDDLVCSGLEAAPDECEFASTSNCAHSEDVYVTCVVPTPAPDAARTQYRLVAHGNDNRNGRGRLEVLSPHTTTTTPPPPTAALGSNASGGGSPASSSVAEEVWRPVCGNGFSVVDAVIACRSLNLTTTAPLVYAAPAATAGFGMDHTACFPGTPNLASCPHVRPNAADSLASKSCSSFTVGIDCSVGGYEYRLRDSTTSGVLQFRPSSTANWTSVCFSGMTQGAATAACRTVAGLTLATATMSASAEMVVGPLMTNVTCSGQPNDQLANGACAFEQPAVGSAPCAAVHLTCNETLDDFSTLESRIDNATGLVLVRPARKGSSSPWGTICARGMTSTTAASLCTAFGRNPDGATEAGWRTLPNASGVAGPVYFSDYSCDSGVQASQCRRTVLTHTCGIGQVLGLDCDAAVVEYRLAGSAGQRSGRLETRRNGSDWAPVCGSSAFQSAAASVACRSLGYPVGTTGVKLPDAAIPSNATAASFALDRYVCQGSETGLALCPRQPMSAATNAMLGGSCDADDQVKIACGADSEGSGCSGSAECNQWVLLAEGLRPAGCNASYRLHANEGEAVVSDADCRVAATGWLVTPSAGAASYVKAADGAYCDVYNCSFNVASMATIANGSMFAPIRLTSAALGFCSRTLSCSGHGEGVSTVDTSSGSKVAVCRCTCDRGYFGDDCSALAAMTTTSNTIDIVYTHPSAALTFAERSSVATTATALLDTPGLTTSLAASASVGTTYIDRLTVTSSTNDQEAAAVSVRAMLQRSTMTQLRDAIAQSKSGVRVVDISTPSFALRSTVAAAQTVLLPAGFDSASAAFGVVNLQSAGAASTAHPAKIRLVTVKVFGAETSSSATARIVSDGVQAAACTLRFADGLRSCAARGECEAQVPFLNASSAQLTVNVAGITSSCTNVTAVQAGFARRQGTATGSTGSSSVVDVSLEATLQEPLDPFSLTPGDPVAARKFATPEAAQLYAILGVVGLLCALGAVGSMWFCANRRVMPALLLALVAAAGGFFYATTTLLSIQALGTGSDPSAALFVDEYRSDKCDTSNVSGVPHRISYAPADGICRQLTSYGSREREYWLGAWCGRAGGDGGYDPTLLTVWAGQTEAKCKEQAGNASLLKASRCYAEGDYYTDKTVDEQQYFKLVCTSMAQMEARTRVVEASLDPQADPATAMASSPMAASDSIFGQGSLTSTLRFFIGKWRSTASQFLFQAQSDQVRSVPLTTFSINDVVTTKVGVETAVVAFSGEAPPSFPQRNPPDDGNGTAMALLGPLFNQNTRDTAYGANAMRYEGIGGTDFDLGTLNPQKGFTITFWVDADANTRGFVYLVTDAWLNSDGSTPIAQRLQTVLENPGRRFYRDTWSAYSGVFLDGGAKTVRFVFRHPDGFESGAGEDLTWSDPSVTSAIFDGGWHFVALLYTSERDRGKVQLVVDGRTSFTQFKYLQCMAYGSRFHPVRELPNTVQVLNNRTDSARQGGVAYVGHLNAGVFAFMVHRRALDYQVMLALGSEQMEEHAAIDVDTTYLAAQLMLLLAMLLFVGTCAQAVMSFVDRRREEHEKQEEAAAKEEEEMRQRHAVADAPAAGTAVVALKGGRLNLHQVEAGVVTVANVGRVDEKEEIDTERVPEKIEGEAPQETAQVTVKEQREKARAVARGKPKGTIKAVGARSAAKYNATRPSALEQLAVIVPIFMSAAQNMAMYFEGWKWPDIYVEWFAWAYLPFNFNFLSFPALPVWVSYAAQFGVALASMILVLVLSRGDRRRFRTGVLEPAEIDGLPIEDADVLAGLPRPVVDDPACHVSALRYHLCSSTAAPATVLGNFSRVTLQNAITRELVADAKRRPVNADTVTVREGENDAAVLVQAPDEHEESAESRASRCFAVLVSNDLDGEQRLLAREKNAIATGVYDGDLTVLHAAAPAMARIAGLPLDAEDKLSLCGLPGATVTPSASNPLLAVYEELVETAATASGGVSMKPLRVRCATGASLERLAGEVSVHLPTVSALKSSVLHILADAITLRRTRALARARESLAGTPEAERPAVIRRIHELRREDFVEHLFASLPAPRAAFTRPPNDTDDDDEKEKKTSAARQVDLSHLAYVRVVEDAVPGTDGAAPVTTVTHRRRSSARPSSECDADNDSGSDSEHSARSSAKALDEHIRRRLTPADVVEALRRHAVAPNTAKGSDYDWLLTFETAAAAQDAPRSLLRAAVDAGIPHDSGDRLERDCAVIAACLRVADTDGDEGGTAACPVTLYAAQALSAVLHPSCLSTPPFGELTDADHDFIADRSYEQLVSAMLTFAAPIAALQAELPKAELKFGYVDVVREPLAPTWSEQQRIRDEHQSQLDDVHRANHAAAKSALERTAEVAEKAAVPAPTTTTSDAAAKKTDSVEMTQVGPSTKQLHPKPAVDEEASGPSDGDDDDDGAHKLQSAGLTVAPDFKLVAVFCEIDVAESSMAVAGEGNGASADDFSPNTASLSMFPTASMALGASESAAFKIAADERAPPALVEAVSRGSTRLVVEPLAVQPRCPTHGKRLLPAIDAVHHILRAADPRFYPCAHRHNIVFQNTCCTPAQAAKRCDVEFSVCPHEGCNFALCQTCQRIGFGSKIAGKVVRFTDTFLKAGTIAVAGLILIVIAQSMYQPAVKSGVSTLFCHVSLLCHFPDCYDPATPDFLAMSISSTFIIVTLGIGLVWFFFASLVRRKMDILESSAVEGHLVRRGGVCGIFSCGDRCGGADVPYSYDGSVSIRDIMTVGIDDTAFRALLRNDKSMFKGLYEQYELQWMVVHPLTFMFKVCTLMAVLYAGEPNSLRLILAVAGVEVAQLFFYVITAPFVDPMLDFLAKSSSLHQVAQLGLVCLHRANTYEDPNDNRALVAMIAISLVYLSIVVAVVVRVAILPVAFGFFGRRKRVNEEREWLRAQRALGLDADGQPLVGSNTMLVHQAVIATTTATPAPNKKGDSVVIPPALDDDVAADDAHPLYESVLAKSCRQWDAAPPAGAATGPPDAPDRKEEEAREADENDVNVDDTEEKEETGKCESKEEKEENEANGRHTQESVARTDGDRQGATPTDTERATPPSDDTAAGDAAGSVAMEPRDVADDVSAAPDDTPPADDRPARESIAVVDVASCGSSDVVGSA